MHTLSLSDRPGARPTRSARLLKITLFVAGFFCLLVKAPNTLAEDQRLTLKQKIGQLFIFSFPGTEFSPALAATLTTFKPGALIFFRSNVSSPPAVAALIAKAQSHVKSGGGPPLFTMVDQEGGAVTRVRSPLPIPSALALATMNDLKFTKNYARTLGEVLFHLGFNVDLAPVMDLSDPEQKTFIGNRTFGRDPRAVRDLTLSYSSGLNEGGLIPTGKHFPGHGGIVGDSHRELPLKNSTLDEIRRADLIPFAGFAKETYPRAVMVAHLSLPNIEPSRLPATYSRILIRDVLRRQLNYTGLVMTDDLEMRGASISADIGERAVRAFEAGNDMLMLAGGVPHQRQAFDALTRAVQSGRISRARLDESVDRIWAAKRSLRAPSPYDERTVTRAFHNLDQLSREVMRRNFKVGLERAAHRWPRITAKTRVLVLGPGQRVARDFARSFKGQTRGLVLSPKNLPRLNAELFKMKEDFAVYFASGRQTVRALTELPREICARLIVINSNNPGEVYRAEDYLSVIHLNSFFGESASWLGSELSVRPPNTSLRAERD